MEQQYLTCFDDRPDLLRIVLKSLLNNSDMQYQVLTELPSTERINSSRPKFALNFVDINFGPDREEEGFEIIKKLRETNPSAYIVGYSTHGNEKTKQKSLRAGANGFFTKEATAPQLIDAFRDQLLLFKNFLSLVKMNIENEYRGIIVDISSDYLIVYKNKMGAHFQSTIASRRLDHIADYIEINTPITMLVGHDAFNRTIIEYRLGEKANEELDETALDNQIDLDIFKDE